MGCEITCFKAGPSSCYKATCLFGPDKIPGLKWMIIVHLLHILEVVFWKTVDLKEVHSDDVHEDV